MRQVRDNPKLETLDLPALTGKDYGVPKNKCSIKVKSCGEQLQNGVSCHRFYKCHDGVAFSCQNPKIFRSTCSERYWGKSGKEAYRCLALSPYVPRDSPDAKDPCV